MSRGMGVWRVTDLPDACRQRNAYVLTTAPQCPETVPHEPALAADLLPKLRKLARANGWEGEHTYNALGPDTGLRVMLLRDVIIFADVKDEGCTRTPSQEHWAAAVQRSGKAETYLWTPAHWPAIVARLTQPPHWETHDAD